MARAIKNITGKKFGRLLVLETVNTQCKCLCDCGRTVYVNKYYLTNGHTKSCGCLYKEVHTKHNLSKTRLYEIHQGMKKRCYNKNSKFYKLYGGRGIYICNEWKNNFLSFYTWAISNGYKDDLTIDRIDNNKGYYPENCRWVTRKEQNNNTRKNIYFEAFGKRQLISCWAKETGIPYSTLRRRILQHKTIKEIFYKNSLKHKGE